MQEGTTEGTEHNVPTESVEDSIIPQEEIEVNNEEVVGKQEVEIYNQQQASFPTSLLPSSSSFAVLQETVEALGAMETLAKVLIRSSLCPLKKVEDITLAIITGNLFGFQFMTSINNIFPINGKPTLSVHLQRALIIKHKIVFRKTAKHEAMYDWAKVDSEGKYITRTVTDAKGNTRQVPIILDRATLKNKPLEPCVASGEVDRITEYEFTRLIKQEDGSFEKLVVTSEFRMSDAAKAELLTKDVWVKYPARMCDARAFAIGAREIASDVTLGISTVSELADAHNIKYTVSESLEETVII